MIDINFSDFLKQEVHHDDELGLMRQLRHMPDGVVSFCDNDYLGLSRDQRLVIAAQKALDAEGVGATAARLVSGNSIWHEALESKLAEWKQVERALLFSSGYATACGVIPALLDREDHVVVDKRIHSCLLDGAKLSGAKLHAFPHNNLDYLESLLKTIRERAATKILIVVESIYSMDGDQSPLREIVDLKEKYGAWLMVDEAHATGIYGERRSGLCEQLNLTQNVEIQMGTLGKAIGVSGGFVVGSVDLIQFLLQRARTFIFTTGTPPALAAASCAAIDVIQSEQGKVLVDQLQKNIRHFTSKLPSRFAQSDDRIVFPLIIGDERKTLKYSDELLSRGFFVPAIRYPTVPKKSARLRVTLRANHAAEQIDFFTDALNSLA